MNELTLAEPKHDGYRYSLANNYARIASAQEGVNAPGRAIEYYQKAMAKHLELRLRDEKDNMPIRAMAVAAQDIARVYEKIRKNDEALEYYRKSVEMFTLLEQKGGIGEYDRKNFETSRKAVERLEKK